MPTFKSGTIHKAKVSTLVKLPEGMNQWEDRWRMYLENGSGWVKKVADTKVVFFEGENEPELECKMPKVKRETEYEIIILRGDGLFLIGRWYIGSPNLLYKGTEKVIVLP